MVIRGKRDASLDNRSHSGHLSDSERAALAANPEKTLRIAARKYARNPKALAAYGLPYIAPNKAKVTR